MAASGSTGSVGNAELESLRRELSRMKTTEQERIAENEQELAAIEKERDFYFGKLRQLEIVCQDKDPESKVRIQEILDVLYATEVS
jgi:RP/EB family microtubule-associated protein